MFLLKLVFIHDSLCYLKETHIKTSLPQNIRLLVVGLRKGLTGMMSYITRPNNDYAGALRLANRIN